MQTRSHHHAATQSGHGLPRGWVILGLALMSWASVFAAWQSVATLFGMIAS